MAMNDQLLISLRGTLDRDRLIMLREALGLQRRGRLDDRDDWNFGHRYLRVGARSPVMTLYRYEDDKWGIAVDSWPGYPADPAEIEQAIADVAAAVAGVGLRVERQQIFPPSPPEPGFATMNRNENWLRTMVWDLPAQTLDELWPVLGLSASAPDAEKHAELRRFMEQPAWEAAPARIRQEAEDFLTR